MKIISKFKDYYDGIQNLGGFDDSLLFVRETKALQKKNFRSPYHGLAFIHFCGKTYITLETREGYKPLDKAIEILDNNKEHYWNTYDSYYNPQRYYRQIDKNYLLKINKEIHNTKDNLQSYRDLGCAYFVERSVDMANDENVILYPKLQDFGFPAFLDPFSCFQEIEMFLSNVLIKKDETPLRVGSDKVIAYQKGFTKESFRTASPGKKYKRRQ